MSRKHFDNVRHLITTPGVGEITFGTVPATWRSFAAAGAVAGDQPGYTIQDGDGIELGYLTIGADALTATRTVIYSSNSNNPLDLSGGAILECTPLASMINDDLVSFVRAQSASSGEKAQARSNLGMTTTGQALATAMNAADARDTIGATTVGSALITAADAAAARAAAGITTVGSALATAADAAAARTAIGVDAAPSTKAANYTVVAADYASLIALSGSATLAFTAAATLGNKFRVFVKNVGTGVWTLDPNGSETIDGQTTLRLYPDEGCEVFCSGSTFYTLGRSTGLVKIARNVVASVTSVVFDGLFTTDFEEYEIHLRDITVSTTAAAVYNHRRGGAVVTGTFGYALGYANGAGAGAAGNTDASTGGIVFAPANVNSGANCFTSRIRVVSPMDNVGLFKQIVFDGAFAANNARYYGAGVCYTDAAANDGFAITLTAGTFSGIVEVYGVRK